MDKPIPEAVLDRLAHEAYQVHCDTPTRAFPNDTHWPKWRAVVQHVADALTAAQQQGQAVAEVKLHDGLLYGRLDADLPVGTKLYTAPQPMQQGGGEVDEVRLDLVPWLYIIRSEFLPDDDNLGRESDRKMREALDWAIASLPVHRTAPPSAPDYPITATCRVCDYDYRCVPVPAKCGTCGSDLPPSVPVGVEGPKAYCRGCNAAGMRNCAHFDECSGARCITCHQQLNRPAQQPAAVDEAMVERGTAAAIAASTRYARTSAVDSWRQLVREVLTAALAAQQGGSDYDR